MHSPALPACPSRLSSTLYDLEPSHLVLHALRRALAIPSSARCVRFRSTPTVVRRIQRCAVELILEQAGVDLVVEVTKPE